MTLVRERYADFGPTLAAEMLAQQHGLTLSRETLRQWMIEAGLWLSRMQRRSFHQPTATPRGVRRIGADNPSQ